MKTTKSALSESNLEDLTVYYEQTGAKSGAMTIDHSDDDVLSSLLRSSLLKEITKAREIKRRSEIDDLLAFYSLLEIGILCGAIERTLPEYLHVEARRHLAREPVRRYYEKLYPLLLPQFLLRRLRNQSGWIGPSSVSYFVAFLEGNRILDSNEVRMFLWFLDEGTVDEDGIEIDLEDVVRALNNPLQFTERFLRPRSQQTSLDEALHGMVQLLGFCENFDKLLRNAPSRLIQSACWHFHGYWFQQLGGQVHGVISAAIEQYRSWIPTPGDRMNTEDLVIIEHTHASMDQSHRSLQRLTSSVYRYALEAILLVDSGALGEAPARALKKLPRRTKLRSKARVRRR